MAAMQPGVERTKLIQKMEDHIQEETPWALMYYRTTYSLTQGWLKNFRSSELILNQYKYYRIDNEQKKATTTR
jgi:ABC-type transport system substrate-binding protein